MNPETTALVVSVVGLILNAGTLLVGAVWVVSKIQTTTENLSAAINRLDETLQTNDDRQRNHAERITRLEATTMGGRHA